jgi:hypothetical protein
VKASTEPILKTNLNLAVIKKKRKTIMIKNLTLTQKIFIALSLPLIIVIINSLMAVIQLQNYQRMIKYEIKTTTLTIVLVSMISIIMVVIMAVFISRSLEFQSVGGKGMTGT